VSDRTETITMVVKIPVEVYTWVMAELLAGIEQAAQNQGIEYEPPKVQR
jgi:hypothetical protein